MVGHCAWRLSEDVQFVAKQVTERFGIENIMIGEM